MTQTASRWIVAGLLVAAHLALGERPAAAQVGDVKPAPIAYEYYPYANVTDAPAGAATTEVDPGLIRST